MSQNLLKSVQTLSVVIETTTVYGQML